jgi:recombination protein RecA
MAAKAKAAAKGSVPSIYGTLSPRCEEVIPTGCTMLDCIIGGGWPVGRMSNLVGNKSSGKTLLAIEAATNFMEKYPSGRVIYFEAESAFDSEYAASLGLPLESVAFPAVNTVEDVFEAMQPLYEEEIPTFVVIDSLDSLSDEAEADRDIRAGTYGATKQKKLSELFRRDVRKMTKSNVTLLIVSQIRDNIGVSFGEKHTRSGGKSIDFYASTIVWLAHIGKIKRTIRGNDRTVGVKVKATVKKNKVAAPFREAEYELYFGYGTEELTSCAKWLKQTLKDSEVKVLDEKLPGDLSLKSLCTGFTAYDLDGESYAAAMDIVRPFTIEYWKAVEDTFAPKRKKYRG